MKNIVIPTLLLVALLCISQIVIAQNCPPKGISTDPDNRVNTEKPSANNIYFDWQTTSYGVFSSNINGSPVTAPFFQTDNTAMNPRFTEDPDRLPEDGWELIKFDMGLDKVTGANNPIPTSFVYVVLYNKFTSVLRVFAAGEGNNDYDGAILKLTFNNASTEYYTSSLSPASGYEAIETATNEDMSTTVCKYLNDGSKWFFGDFHLAYDPCTCEFESSMFVEIRLIRTSRIDINGTLSGELTSIDNRSGEVKEDGFSWNGLVDAGKKAQKAYSSIDKFVTKQETALDQEGQTNTQLAAKKADKKKKLNKLQSVIKKSSFLKAGLKAAPFVGGALELLDFFVGGGKKPAGPQEVEIMPMAIQANMELQGTLVTDPAFQDITFHTPGSKNAEIRFEGDYPYYNEVMGLFNFLETPVLNYSTSIIETYCVPDPADDRIEYCEDTWGGLIKMQNFDYVANPLVFTQTPEILASIHIKSNTSNFSFTDGTMIDLGNGLRRTGYIPVDCIDELAIPIEIFDTPSPSTFVSELYIKVIVNMPRPNDQQNILFMATYPMKWESVSSLTNNGIYSGIKGGDITLSNTTVSSDILTWGTVTIGNNVNFSGNITIAAAEGVTVQTGVTLPTNVTLTAEVDGGCSGVKSPLGATAIDNFCNSSKYKKTERIPSKQLDNVEPTTSLPSIGKLIVYPNPTDRQFEFVLPVEAGQATIQLFDVQGKEVLNTTATGEIISVEVDQLTKGMYLLRVANEAGQWTSKVMVE